MKILLQEDKHYYYDPNSLVVNNKEYIIKPEFPLNTEITTKAMRKLTYDGNQGKFSFKDLGANLANSLFAHALIENKTSFYKLLYQENKNIDPNIFLFHPLKNEGKCLFDYVAEQCNSHRSLDGIFFLLKHGAKGNENILLEKAKQTDDQITRFRFLLAYNVLMYNQKYTDEFIAKHIDSYQNEFREINLSATSEKILKRFRLDHNFGLADTQEELARLYSINLPVEPIRKLGDTTRVEYLIKENALLNTIEEKKDRELTLFFLLTKTMRHMNMDEKDFDISLFSKEDIKNETVDRVKTERESYKDVVYNSAIPLTDTAIEERNRILQMIDERLNPVEEKSISNEALDQQTKSWRDLFKRR